MSMDPVVAELVQRGVVEVVKGVFQAVVGEHCNRLCSECAKRGVKSAVFRKGFGVLWGFHWCYYCSLNHHAGANPERCAWTVDTKDDDKSHFGLPM
jgi:hypothetical protein